LRQPAPLDDDYYANEAIFLTQSYIDDMPTPRSTHAGSSEYGQLNLRQLRPDEEPSAGGYGVFGDKEHHTYDVLPREAGQPANQYEQMQDALDSDANYAAQFDAPVYDLVPPADMYAVETMVRSKKSRRQRGAKPTHSEETRAHKEMLSAQRAPVQYDKYFHEEIPSVETEGSSP